MAKKPIAPEEDGTTTVPGADILPEGQATSPPIAENDQPPEVNAEEAVILEEEGKADLFEMGKLFPDPGEVVIPADLTEQLLTEKNGAEIAAAKEAEAASTEKPAPEAGQGDTR